ncbi:helix-turn-helix domain-containing protein [Alloactinosynnema sp. L-07]|uniref:helix-turn-helix domain-containing protein n=1 Tax=Alloactinosynnema sp. L-07 TaxID=1653480 RepID=UPI0018D2F1D3
MSGRTARPRKRPAGLLRAVVSSPEVSAAVATRARIVLWRAQGRPKVEISELAGVSRPTVDLWLDRFAAEGVAGLLDRPRGAGREQVPASIRARVGSARRWRRGCRTGRAGRWRRSSPEPSRSRCRTTMCRNCGGTTG